MPHIQKKNRVSTDQYVLYVFVSRPCRAHQVAAQGATHAQRGPSPAIAYLEDGGVVAQRGTVGGGGGGGICLVFVFDVVSSMKEVGSICLVMKDVIIIRRYILLAIKKSNVFFYLMWFNRYSKTVVSSLNEVQLAVSFLMWCPS